MSDEDTEKFEVKQQIWTPKLVELTKAPHPYVDEGNPTKMYIDPRYVEVIERGRTRYRGDNGAELPAIECTLVVVSRSIVYVLEAPEEVARRVNLSMTRTR